jgi:signal transduction histidine kinase
MSALVVISIIAYLTLAIKLFRDDKTTLIYDLNANVVRTIGSEFRGDLERFSSVVRLLAQGSQNSDWTRVVLSNENQLLAFRLYDEKEPGSPWGGAEVTAANAIDRASAWLEEKSLPQEKWTAWLESEVAHFRKAAGSTGEWNRRTPWLASAFVAENAPVLVYAEEVKFEGFPKPRLLVGFFRIDRWWATLKNQGVVTPFLVSGTGELLLATDPQELGKGKNYRTHPLVAQALDSPVALAMRAFRWEDRDYLGAFSDVGKAGVKVVSMAPSEQVFRASMRLVNKSLLFALLIVTIALWISTRVARSLTQPLSELVEATESVSRGKFEKPLAITSRDEVGELSRAFNSMAGSLDRLQKQLIESERHAAIGQVARGVGHEFGNILMRVFGKIDLALLDTQEPKTRAHLETAMQAIERAKIILQNLRSYSKTTVPGAEGEARRESLALATVFDQTLTLIAHELKTGNVEVIRNYAEAPNIEGDGPALGQVFLNLLINAKQAMPKGGKLVVSVGPKADAMGGAGVETTVADDGMGIPADVLPHIFETAFSTKGDQGSGLGLSISKSIIEKHGGTIAAESPAGSGAVFRIWLPVKPPAEGATHGE